MPETVRFSRKEIAAIRRALDQPRFTRTELEQLRRAVYLISQTDADAQVNTDPAARQAQASALAKLTAVVGKSPLEHALAETATSIDVKRVATTHDVCGACGATKPVGQSCICFDNNSQ
jgi:hypothetical protein